jgi:predicted MFS family arabinose efflux permease
LAFAAFGAAGKLLLGWILLWLLYSAAGQLILMQAWTAAVASNFVAGRGLALAITLTGSAVTATLIPRTAVWLISSYGWRGAYGVMGLIWAVGGGLLVFLLFRSKQDEARGGKAAASNEALAGVSAREGLTSARFAKIAVTALVGEIVIVPLVVNLIPMLHEGGIVRENAAWVAGAIGASAVVGKLACGAVAHRVGGQYIMAFLLALPIATAMILMEPNPTVLSAILAASFLGFSSGGQLEMLVYMVARHFGLRAFGAIFGVIGGVLSLAIGVGPIIAGKIFDLTGSYYLMLVADIPLSLIGVGLMLILGNYPDQLPAAAPAALAEAAE